MIMEYLHSEQNKLIQALDRKDWPAVRSICGTEPHLVNTTDQIYDTPLTRAAASYVPEDIMLMLIENATAENLEHVIPAGGFNILHSLAFRAYVRAMRHVLNRTLRHVNRRNDAGSTPLHYCLENSLYTYDQQREMALCLLTYGASLSIKDHWRRTPLDLYDDNECSKYEENTRSEKKKELRALLEELSVPAEIIARGEEAVKAFKDAIQNGEITVVNSRFMFLGKEGAGKTSCVNAMLGKAFNAHEPLTDGITTTVFQTVGEDCSKWEEQKDVDECELTKQIRDHAIAANIAKELKQPESQQNISSSASLSASDPGRRTSLSGSTASSMVELPEAVMPMTSQGRSRGQLHVPHGAGAISMNQTVSRANRFEKKLPEGIHKKLVDELADQNPGPSNVSPSDVTCIWDYGGHLTYYITHRFFLTDGSSYGVVFSLLDKLDALAKPRDSQKGPFEMTNLQMNVFWIRSIYEHAVLPYSAKKRHLINNNIASPPISLIGTHMDQLSGSEEEKQTKIEGIFNRIFDEIKGTPYEKHVDREMYVVDNTAASDKGIEKLKKNVGGYLKAMAKTVPINWVDFQSKVQEVGKTRVRISLDEITKIAVECGISNEHAIHVLNYLNDLGIILYSPTNKKLKNTVVTNIHMLIGIFTKIITVVKPDDHDKLPVLMKSWHLLDDEGILCEALLRHLWKSELEEDESNFEVFIELMKLFGLIFEKQQEFDDRAFIVPSRMTIIKECLEVKKDEKQTVSIYVTPTDFLPDAVYNMLVVAFVDLMKVKVRRDDAELFRNRSDFDLDDNHLVSLGVVKIKNRHALKLEISHRVEVDENGTHVISEPQPSVCMEVLNYLRHQLKTVYVTTEGIGYELRVLCNACQPTQQPHFHDLEDCLNKDSVPCKNRGQKLSMKTSRFKRFLALTDLNPEFIKETKNFQVIQSLVIDLGTRKMKEFFLKTVQQTSSSVVEFLKDEKENGSFAEMEDFPGQDKIFSPDADINTFDIAILMRLIRYCCRFTYPDDIWEQPDKIDNLDLANLIRIQQYKNTKLDQNTSCRIPTKDFDEEWTGIKEIFLDLGVPDKEIEDVQLRKDFDKTDIDEMQNFQAVMSLVVDLGTEAMRKNFLRVSNLKPKNVGQFLMNEKNIFKKAELSPEQKNKMFPTNAKADIKSFDISIMIKIIRHCNHCFSFWSEPADMHIFANLVSIHQYRNTRLAHSASARMSTEEFEVEWKKLTSMLQGVGVSIEEIDKYRQLRLTI